jgi:hypothetical protein
MVLVFGHTTFQIPKKNLTSRLVLDFASSKKEIKKNLAHGRLSKLSLRSSQKINSSCAFAIHK